MLRTLFASWHTYLDQSNGASISTRALLLELARRHWDVSTFCALSQDFQRNQTLEEMLASHRIRANKTIAGDGFSTTSFWDSGVKSLALVPSTIRRVPSRSDVALYMRFFKETLVQTQPNVVLSYGGYGLAQPLFREARAFGAKVAVFLHNLAYNRRDYFQHVDIVFVPSHFAAEFYRRKIGLETIAIPPLIDSSRAEALQNKTTPSPDRNHVLFVNPEQGKGVRFLIAIAKEIWRLRRDIRFLVVEGREGRNSLLRFGKEILKDVRNIDYAPNVVDFQRLYAHARITLFPSLYEETFGRVATESLNAGVPVVASDRGALPEVVGNSGVILSIPEKFQPESDVAPNESEIEPWVRAILRLWDDATFYAEKQECGREQAENWRFDVVADRYEERLMELAGKTCRY